MLNPYLRLLYTSVAVQGRVGHRVTGRMEVLFGSFSFKKRNASPAKTP